jgi:DNA-binding NarL/FixJ family response regulator
MCSLTTVQWGTTASAGATDYILKDAERHQLLEAVHAALGQRGEG